MLPFADLLTLPSGHLRQSSVFEEAEHQQEEVDHVQTDADHADAFQHEIKDVAKVDRTQVGRDSHVILEKN